MNAASRAPLLRLPAFGYRFRAQTTASPATGFACDVVPRLERRLTAHASHSAMFAAYVVGAGGLLGGDAWARGEDRRLARGG